MFVAAIAPDGNTASGSVTNLAARLSDAAAGGEVDPAEEGLPHLLLRLEAQPRVLGVPLGLRERPHP